FDFARPARIFHFTFVNAESRRVSKELPIQSLSFSPRPLHCNPSEFCRSEKISSGDLIEFFSACVTGDDECRKRAASLGRQFVTMCSGNFLDQSMSAKQAQQPRDLAGRSTAIVRGLASRIQQRSYVAVSESVDRELPVQQDRGESRVLSG